MSRIFRNRVEAGRELGIRLRALDLGGDLLVLGLPRGGVPVACEVAAALAAPVDVLVVRKLGAPHNRELAVGAIAFGGVTVYNDELLEMLNLTEEDLEPTRRSELAELSRREGAYRGGAAPLAIANRTVILVDDGVATGATMHAAVLATRRLQPRRIIVAAPTASSDSVERLEKVADQLVVLETPEPYYAVGAWYAEFSQLRDEEVVACLAAATTRTAAGGGSGDGPSAPSA
jgi:putative phosphoribosyl transferase